LLTYGNLFRIFEDILQLFGMEASNKVPLLAEEIIFDYWDIYYTFSDGSYFFGTITVTNKRIFFETKTEGAVEAMLANSAFFTNHITNYVVLSKKEIASIDNVKSFTSNQVVITLKNGEKHFLDRKMLSVDKIVDALKKN